MSAITKVTDPSPSSDGPDGIARSDVKDGSFFRMYKPGQGYWTRLGTAIGASVVILFVASQVYKSLLPVIGVNDRPVRFAISAGFGLVAAVFTWWLVNGSSRAQFLIETDSEMKKVNWATRSELFGSTRVVIAFMLSIALLLFVLDTQFHAFFYKSTVWKVPFDGSAGLITGAILVSALLIFGVLLYKGSELDSKRIRTGGIFLLAAGAVVAAIWGYYAVSLFSS